MKKFFYTISLLIVMFYSLNPLYENKKLNLSLNQILYLSDSGAYIIFDKTSKNRFYINLLTKYKNNWIGNILDCSDAHLITYERTDSNEEGPGLDIVEGNGCAFYKEKKGYFLINDKGEMKYNIDLKNFNERIKFKSPGYYIKKFGEEKGINNRYFSADTTVNIFQKPSEVAKTASLIRNIMYLIFVFPSIILVIRDLKRVKNKNKSTIKNDII